MIECTGISKVFQTSDTKTIALDSVDLSIPEGEFLMIMGPSGCGKTTLLSVIAGILKSDAGTCSVFGHNLSSNEDFLDFRSKNIGFIFQSFHLIPTLSVLENIAIPLLILGHKREAALDKASYFLKSVGLEGKGTLRPRMLSGGQQQRIAIARALVHSPKLVICDEPTSALDHVTGMSILELMKSMNKQTTFVIVTHDQRIERYADRIVHMDDGKIVRTHQQ